VGKFKSAIFDKCLAIAKTVQDRDIVTVER